MTSTRAPRASGKVSNQKPSNKRPLNYRREVSVQLTPTREMKLTDRRYNAVHVPRAALKPGLLSQELQNKLNIHRMNSGERIYWRKSSQTHFASVYLDENLTRPCHKEMKRLQELVLKSKTSKNLRRNGKKGDLIYLSVSTQRSGWWIQPSSGFRNKETSKDDPEIQEMIKVMGSLVAKLFNIGLPSEMVDLLHKRSAADVSLGAGHHDNVYTSQIQGNVSLLQEDLPTAIGAGGALHIDSNNDPARLSIVIFLSHLPPDYCPGKFILPSESVYCVTAPYTAIICSGHLPHWPIPPRKYEPNSIRYIPAGPIPQPLKDVEYRRISMVSYPERTSMNKAPKHVTDILLKPESLYVFGTKRNQHEFWARLQGKKTVEEALQGGIELDEDDVSQIILDNLWNEHGETKFPRSQLIKEILFGDSEKEWLEREKFISENISCGYFFEGGRRKSEAILTDVEDNSGDETSVDEADFDELEVKLPTVVNRPAIKGIKERQRNVELHSSEDIESDEISSKNPGQMNNSIEIRKHWETAATVIANKDSESDQDFEFLKDRDSNSKPGEIESEANTDDGELSNIESNSDSDDNSTSNAESGSDDSEASSRSWTTPILANPASTKSFFRSLDDMSFMNKTNGFDNSRTKRKRSLSESEIAAKVRKPWAFSPLDYSPQSASLSDTEHNVQSTTLKKGAADDKYEKMPWDYTPLEYESASVRSLSQENNIQPITIETSAFDEKYEDHLKMLMDGILDNSITLEEYNAEVIKLGQLKAHSSKNIDKSSS